ncbi:hypothetical protein QU42_17815 [Bradyrhizobium sp. UASWS1016]|nr:hypothetical protein QU41_20075 [Bradyrhizobium elkanii]OCX29553.1 hypothetical protein QU42_17815 [Bradyrhizobium sp. UASWS1016]
MCQIVERRIFAIDLATVVHLLRTFAKRIEFLEFLRIGFDARLHHRMLITHDEQQDAPSKSRRLIELKFGQREPIRISFRIDQYLAVSVANHTDVRKGVADHRQRRIDHVRFSLRPGKFHHPRRVAQLLDRLDHTRPMLLQVVEGARQHDRLEVFGFIRLRIGH